MCGWTVIMLMCNAQPVVGTFTSYSDLRSHSSHTNKMYLVNTPSPFRLISHQYERKTILAKAVTYLLSNTLSICDNYG